MSNLGILIQVFICGFLVVSIVIRVAGIVPDSDIHFPIGILAMTVAMLGLEFYTRRKTKNAVC